MMALFRKLRASIARLDPNALQLRLIVGVVLVAAIGLGSVALWFSWQMERALLATHRDNVMYILDRLPSRVEMYEEVYPLQEAVQKSLNRLADGQTQLWIVDDRGRVSWQAPAIDPAAEPATLLPREAWPVALQRPQVTNVDGRFWIVCAVSLEARDRSLGTVYIAEDINSDRLLLSHLIHNLGIASAVSLTLTAVLLTMYVRRSLAPLQTMCEMVEQVSAEHLQEGLLQLKAAPSEVRRLAQSYDRMLIRLADSWEQQRQFVSDVSHELRTPLTIVSGYLQSTLRRGDNLSAVQKEALTTAAAEADRTVQLLGDLLALARADSGHMHFHPEAIELDEFLRTIAAMTLQFSGRDIGLDLRRPGLQIRADRERLKQVLLNLIDNAVKYSEPEAPIDLRLESSCGLAQIQVCDRGRGIPLPDQVRIFERFYRVDEARSRSSGGTGLGLSIVKTLVEGMGGTVVVSSAPGAGSTFTLAFPLLAARLPAAELPRSPASTGSSGGSR